MYYYFIPELYMIMENISGLNWFDLTANKSFPKSSIVTEITNT